MRMALRVILWIISIALLIFGFVYLRKKKKDWKEAEERPKKVEVIQANLISLACYVGSIGVVYLSTYI